MTGPSLDVVFNYLALLISEREAGKPFLISQLQQAITYKFPNFNFADYKLGGLKDFVLMGEKSGYFNLVNTGNPQTSYLAAGIKQPPPPTPQPESVEHLPENDPRRMRWMQLALENMLTADRADQLFDAIKGIDALTPSFDSFLAAQGNSAQQYPVRGKISRIRNFLKLCREQGEAQARNDWQVSRTVTRMPPIPPLQNAAATQSLIWSLMQGTTLLESVPLEKLNNMFFAVLTFCKKEMSRSRSLDWVAGLEMLDADARAIPRPVPSSQKRGLFSGGKAPASSPYELDDFEIEVLAEDLRKAAGIRASMTDPTVMWKAYLDAPTPNASVQFLNDHANLLESDGLMTWLEEQIGDNVAGGKMDAVQNLATKAAIVIVARQRKAGQPPDDLRAVYDSIMGGATLLGKLFAYIDTASTAEAAEYLRSHNELMDQDTIGPLIEEQALKATRDGDRARYRRISERLDLWRNVAEFGMENGVQQHQRFLARARTDEAVEAEMGLMLLVGAESVDEQRDAMERYPAVGSKEGLALVDGMLDMLSFHNDSEQYNRYHTIKRLIERCLEVGVDRALSELR